MKLFEFIDLNISHVHPQKKKKKSEKRGVKQNVKKLFLGYG